MYFKLDLSFHMFTIFFLNKTNNQSCKKISTTTNISIRKEYLFLSSIQLHLFKIITYLTFFNLKFDRRSYSKNYVNIVKLNHSSRNFINKASHNKRYFA
jgi:hypothetical protein